jgi:hypothetical protein
MCGPIRANIKQIRSGAGGLYWNQWQQHLWKFQLADFAQQNLAGNRTYLDTLFK